ncbi:hypothetical protein MST22_15765 [Virgibacillus halodenitrificans]|uniref:hypothetical protein n=1 Tax=Virgibacillus halodenitrificans TaxID=1482 RepID=UPI001FB3A248|nr:hypothetical protein [Virgibacillus halodenitrificans]MCJ0932605.1 hypothetical protein [Virgibacillus halodenitrificans]
MNKKYYYVSGNTAKGLVNHLKSNIEDINQVVILRHPSLTLKTMVINEFIKKQKKNDYEIFLSAFGKEFLDGVIVRDKSIAIVSDHIASEVTGAFELDLNLFIKGEPSTTASKAHIHHLEEAHQSFKTGLSVHDDLEEVYINEMDFEKANQLTSDFINMVLEEFPKINRNASRRTRLFGTNTKDGVVNVVPHLLEQVSNAYFIKGRAGTGKSTLMKKVASACEDYGYDVELYYCSFDPNSVDMVFVPEMNFCIFDSTDPHEFFPDRASDKIIDMYEKLISPGTDEAHAARIHELNNRYKSYMKKGIEELKIAGEAMEKEEQKYNITKTEVQEINNFIINMIQD